MVAENTIKCRHLRRLRPGRGGGNLHAVLDGRGTGAHQLAIDLDHAGVAGLHRSELWMVTNLRKRSANAVDHIHYQFTRFSLQHPIVHRYVGHGSLPYSSLLQKPTPSLAASSAQG